MNDLDAEIQDEIQDGHGDDVKQAMELNDHIQVIFAEMCKLSHYDRPFALMSVMGLLGIDPGDLE